jgi:hypothetical protein
MGGQANFYTNNCSDLPSFPPLRTTGTPSDESGQLTGEQVGDKRNSIGDKRSSDGQDRLVT